MPLPDEHLTPATPSAAFRRFLAWSVAACGGIFVLVYFVMPSSTAQNIAYVADGVVTTGLMVLGVRLNQPSDRWAWWLLIAANAASTAGDGIENVLYTLVLHRDVPFPSVADLAYLLAYPFMFIGVARVCRTGNEAGGRENYADASIVALAALAISWHFLMGTTMHRSDIGMFGKLVVMAYPFMDIGVLFIMVRSVVFGSGRLAVHRILALAMACTLVADSVYDVLVQHNAYATGNPIDAGWLVNYVLMAVAALHPSVAAEPAGRITQPAAGAFRSWPSPASCRPGCSSSMGCRVTTTRCPYWPASPSWSSPSRVPACRGCSRASGPPPAGPRLTRPLWRRRCGPGSSWRRTCAIRPSTTR